MAGPKFTEFAHRAWADAKRKRLEFAHVCCVEANTHDSVTEVIDAFCTAATGDLEQGPVVISYLVHCDADVSIATDRYGEAISAYNNEENKLSFKTFESWRDSADRQILLLDADGATTSSMDTLVMLHITQELELRAKNGGLQCLVVSVSGDYDPPVWRVNTLSPRKFSLRGKGFLAIQHDAGLWWKSLLRITQDRLKPRLEVLDNEKKHLQHLLREENGPTIVLLMHYHDAWALFNSLRVMSRSVELGCITPWSDESDIRLAISPSRCLKLIHIDDGVRMMPLIEGAEVLIGPMGCEFHFDPEKYCVIRASDSLGGHMDPRIHAASSLTSDPPLVHTFTGSIAVDTESLSLAFGDQLLHLQLGCINSCKDRHPADLPIRFPGDTLMLIEAVRRLGAWGLAGHDEVVIQQPRVRRPLGTQAARFLPFTSNINAAVLLGCIEGGMSNAVTNVLVDMAVMVCQGPCTVFHMTSVDMKMKTVEEIGLLGEPIVKLVHKGQLWLSVACLNVFRRRQLPDPLPSMLRAEVLSRVLRRTTTIKSHLGIAAADGEQELTEADVRVVDEQLARAFVFNILLAGRSEGYSAVDFISCARLSKPAHDTLDWDRLGQESDKPGVVAGIYTYLEPWRSKDAKLGLSYQPCDVTVVSLGAVLKALRGSDREQLRPRAVSDAGKDVVDHYLEGVDIADLEDTAHGAGQQVAPVAPEPGQSAAPPAVAATAAATQYSGVGLQETSKYVETSSMRAPAEGGFKLADFKTRRHQPRPKFRHP